MCTPQIRCSGQACTCHPGNCVEDGINVKDYISVSVVRCSEITSLKVESCCFTEWQCK